MAQIRIGSWFLRVRPYIPFTSLNTVLRKLDREARTVLDVGCGKGVPARAIKQRTGARIVGCDIFIPYLQECGRKGYHDALLVCDVRALPFVEKSVDVVVCLEVIEHLGRQDALELLQDLQAIARRQIILSVPRGAYEQHEYDGNRHQEHKSVWSPTDFRQLGYKVCGHGVRNLAGEAGLASRLPPLLRPSWYFLWVLAGLLVYRRPEWCGDMVCVKTFSPK